MSNADILFVANNKNASLFRNDPSFIYRCENLSLALGDIGVTSNLLHLSQLNSGIIPKVAIFHRPLASFSQFRQIWRLRRRGVVVIADVDDLIFDPRFSGYSPGVLNQQVPLKATQKRVRAHKRAFSWFDGLTVSTPPLAKHIFELYPEIPVKLIPNSVHHSWRSQRPEKTAESKVKILTYFPGTRSHNRDFQTIKTPLASFLNRHADVQLHITGPLDFSLDVNPNQIRHQDRVPYDQYLALFKSGWINLAPLENTPFNQCKSALKAIEAGFFGTPTLCSKNPDFERLTAAGAMIATNKNEWLEQLERMLDPQEYALKSNDLKEKTISIADIHMQASRLVDFLDTLQQSRSDTSSPIISREIRTSL